MTHKINHADIKEWAANYDGEPFDAILCDPPYELGFMGKSWDSTGIAFDTDLWKDLLRICKPGAHLLAFSGSRTYHRMAVAIEDAGFEIRDMIEWVYGSGFPKSLNIGKAVDKIQGNEREVVGNYTKTDFSDIKSGDNKMFNHDGTKKIELDITKGTSEWEGYGTALKPAHEPCVLARKPLDGTVANNVLKHGTGGLNIDGTRVGTETLGGGTMPDLRDVGAMSKENSGIDKLSFGQNHRPATRKEQPTYTGRFPANLIHDGSDEVEAVFPQTGASKAAKRGLQHSGRHGGIADGGNIKDGTDTVRGHNDNGGSASRFFYTAKASKSERNAGLEGFEPQITNDGREKDIDNAFQRGTTLRSNHHPTVKPLSLTKYLATLIKPPTGGRLLVPFSGSGSEMIGALQAGWGYVEGVELTEEYIPIAEARIKYWLNKVEEESKQGVLL